MFGNYKNISDNSIPLDDFLSLCKLDSEKQKLFLAMDYEMKNIHQNNCYINDFNPKNIMVSDDSDKISVFYKDVREGCVEDVKKQNIFYLSFLAVGAYSGCLNYISPKQADFMISNFKEFSQFIPVDDVPYYRGAIVSHSSVYYSDYVVARQDREMKTLQSLSDSFGSNKGNGISLTKATNVGKMNASDDKNQAAFVAIVLFPLMIMLAGLIIPFLVSLCS